MDLKEVGIALLSTTTIAFNANGDTVLYTVPAGFRCAPMCALVEAGSDAGATTTLSIGQNGAETDFISGMVLSNLDAQYDGVILRTSSASPPPKIKWYAPGTVIEGQVTNQSGGPVNTIKLFGILRPA